MLNKPTMIMLIGVPGSGKSTWRNEFIDHFGMDQYSVISTDDYIDYAAKQQSKTYSEVFEDTIKAAENSMNITLKFNTSLGRSLIVDRTNTSVKSRKKILDQIPEIYYKMALFFETPEDLDYRLSRRLGKHIPNNIMESMIKNLTPPSYDEGFDMISHYQHKKRDW